MKYLVLFYKCLEHLTLANHLICDSGKFQLLDDLLPQMKNNMDRVLIFSQVGVRIINTDLFLMLMMIS